MTSRKKHHRFNEAAIIRSRKANWRGRTCKRRSGFNEAAIIRSRKGADLLALPLLIISASMRPRSFDRGKWLIFFDSRSDVIASMRPRSFDRGKGATGAWAAVATSGFNEAAIIRSRKASHGSGLVLAAQSFNEAAIIRSRKEIETQKIEARLPGFNEAAIIRSRKGLSAAPSTPRLLHASMRPRSFDRGKT